MSSGRGPQRSPAAELPARLALQRLGQLRAAPGDERRLHRHDGVEVVGLGRAAHRLGLVDRRRSPPPCRPGRPARRRPTGGGRPGRRGSIRGPGTPERHLPLDPDGDVVECDRDRGPQLLTVTTTARHPGIGPAGGGDPGGQRLEQRAARRSPRSPRPGRPASRSRRCRTGRRCARPAARSTRSSTSTSNGCGRACSSGSTPWAPRARMPARMIESIGLRSLRGGPLRTLSIP